MKNKITAVPAHSKIVLYVWSRCPHSRMILEDLAQLPDAIIDRFVSIDVEAVLDSGDYPPPMTHTPCLFISEMSADGGRPMPMVLNGRKQILLFCGLRAADAAAPMDEREAQGVDKISSFFQKTDVHESGSRGDMSKLVDHGHFDFVVDEASAMQTSKAGAGTREKLFNAMIDDPTVAEDPRVKRKVADALSDLMKTRGYAG